MNAVHWPSEWGPKASWRVIEPLASFISAAGRRKAALMSAMSVLVSEVV